MSPSPGDSAGDLCPGFPGVCGVPGGLQGLPVRTALPRELCVHGEQPSPALWGTTEQYL